MKKLMVAGAMLGIAALVSGCGSVSKEEVVKKNYNLIVHNVGGNLCNVFIIGQVAAQRGYTDVKFTVTDNNTTCVSLRKTEETCEETTYDGDGADSQHSCLLGTDKKPTE